MIWLHGSGFSVPEIDHHADLRRGRSIPKVWLRVPRRTGDVCAGYNPQEKIAAISQLQKKAEDLSQCSRFYLWCRWQSGYLLFWSDEAFRSLHSSIPVPVLDFSICNYFLYLTDVCSCWYCCLVLLHS